MAVYIFMVLFLYSCSWLDFKANRKIGYILFKGDKTKCDKLSSFV